MGKAAAIVILCLAATFGLSKSNSLQSYNISELKCIKQFCVPPGYNKHEGPFIETGHMEILVDFDGAQVIEIDDVKFSIKFIMYLGLTWVDPRIVYLPDGEEEFPVPVDVDFGSYLWLPELYIHDLREITYSKYYKPFAGQ